MKGYIIMKENIVRRIFKFYYEGFKQMTIGRTLWAIIIVKLIIIFAFLRVFFFQPALTGSDTDKASQVRANLVERSLALDSETENIEIMK